MPALKNMSESATAELIRQLATELAHAHTALGVNRAHLNDAQVAAVERDMKARFGNLGGDSFHRAGMRAHLLHHSQMCLGHCIRLEREEGEQAQAA
jgi:hypothetical protein